MTDGETDDATDDATDDTADDDSGRRSASADVVPRARLERLDAFLADRNLAAVWFARPASFAWLTGGDNVVDRAGDHGVAAAGYDGDRVTVVTDDIEAQRLRDEEVDVPVESYEWHATSLADAVANRSPTPAGADFDVPGFAGVDPTGLRQPLTDPDVELYRALGADAAAAVETVCRDCAPGDTERDVAARLHGELATEGIYSPVVLVGGGERAPRYRHYTPKDVPLGDYALVSVTAERHGLHASLTRTVAFDAPEWLADRHAAAAAVEVTAMAATRAAGASGGQRGRGGRSEWGSPSGRTGTAADVFAAIQEAYAAVGHEGEWREHHQGGAAGFAGREWIATPTSDAAVHIPMAYAWNPTVQGAKSEGTVLVTEGGVERLTAGDWPTIEATAIDGATDSAEDGTLTLERPAILERLPGRN